MKSMRSRGAMIALIGGATTLLALIGVGLFGLLRGPAAAQTAELQTTTASSRPAQLEPVATPNEVAETKDAGRFARSVGSALFGWDTRADGGANAWAQPLIDASDGDEANGVAADVRSYIPDGALWDELRTYGTRQRLRIEAIKVPDAWAAARSQASALQLPPGASAFTISGTAERNGMWKGTPVASERAVSFTVFIDCPDSHPCRLLRLSRPDAPLR